jgi:hypothetical protein
MVLWNPLSFALSAGNFGKPEQSSVAPFEAKGLE